MSEWVRFCETASLEGSGVFAGQVDGHPVAVFSDAGTLFAIEDECTHARSRLSSGPVQRGQVFCPRHGSRFCLKTGKALSPPASGSVAVWEVRVHNDWVEVRNPDEAAGIHPHS